MKSNSKPRSGVQQLTEGIGLDFFHPMIASLRPAVSPLPIRIFSVTVRTPVWKEDQRKGEAKEGGTTDVHDDYQSVTKMMTTAMIIPAL